MQPQVTDEENPRLQVHVLEVTEPEPGLKEWEIEHPRQCPRVCRWFPGAREVVAGAAAAGGIEFGSVEELDCLVAYWTMNVGLDGLDVSELAGRAPELDPFGQWRLLPPGRYLIEAWFTPFYWAGSEPCDADGGLTLIGPEPEDG